MNFNQNLISNISLTPLGAGDLIDRAVRFYRKNFWTFILIASPPIVVGTVISVVWTMLGREIFSISSATAGSAETVFYYLFTWFGAIVIWLSETIATLTVMGGASRNFVRHLLFNEPVTFRETYANVRKRLGGLIVVSIIIAFLLGIIGSAIGYFGLIVATIAVIITIAAFDFSPFLTFIVSLALVFAIVFATGWLFFLVASRFAYVPQAMLVEQQGVFAAIGRSASLAGGNVRRLAALFVFSTVATYSALALLYLPLGWYAYLNGIQIFTFDADTIPAWYEIASQLVWQISFILLMPVWMIGLCLLYVDERVRHEGYDIELMAARQLGEIPALPNELVNPLQPALAATNLQNPKQKRSSSVLGLE